MANPVRWAFGATILLIVFDLLSILQSPRGILTMPIYTFIAFSLWRAKSWGGFGAALYSATSVLVIALAILSRLSPATDAVFAGTLIFDILLVWIFFRAGRTLQGDEPVVWKEGRLWITGCLLLGSSSALFLGFYRAYIIPTGGMENTFLIGDQIIVSRTRPSTISRGDIVVMISPDHTITTVKRVVGIPGDRIRIVNKQLLINGIAPTEPYVAHKDEYVDSYRDNFPSEANVPVDPEAVDMLEEHVVNGEVLVPEGKYFTMGDNRDRSLDSRFSGLVAREDIIGKPALVYWSVESDPGTKSNWLTDTRWNRIFARIKSYPLGQ